MSRVPLISFGLRDYGTATWEGGDPDCDHRESTPSRTAASVASSTLGGGKDNIHRSHEFKGDCGRCGARRIDRQIGLEPTPEDFVEAMRVVAREVWRVLRDDASWWLNLGDTFNAYNGNRGPSMSFSAKTEEQLPSLPRGYGLTAKDLKPKDLCMIPERVALALQADGWYVRAKPPWIKPAPMPESTDDRPNVAHESVYLLTKRSTYFFDMEAVRVPSAASTLERDAYSRITSGKDGAYAVQHDHETPSDPGGRHLRTNDFFTASLDALIEHHEAYLAHLRRVRDKGGLLASEDGDPLAFWVSTQSFKGAHFATWPARLVEPMVKASTSEKGCCAACGAPWARIIEREPMVIDRSGRGEMMGEFGRTAASGTMVSPPKATTLGWRPSCSCNSPLPPAPCVVLDCFNGAGSSGVVATGLNRRYVGIDLNSEYLAMSRRRIDRPHARPKRPAKQAESLPLFSATEAVS